MKILEEARLKLASLSVFRGVLGDPVVRAFRDMLDACDKEAFAQFGYRDSPDAQGGGRIAGGFRPLPEHKRLDLYSEFVRRMLDNGGDWSAYLLDVVLRDENRYSLDTARKNAIPEYLESMVLRELGALEDIGRITSGDVAREIGPHAPAGGWTTSWLDYAAAFRERMARVCELGYGIFAGNYMFRLKDGELAPVLHPDPVDPGLLTGYDRERRAVEANTLALLDGKPAANVLLYGDSGTGKSTCVKAVANSLRDRGLRLIELGKDQLGMIPVLIDRLNGNPLKFILFIDDLSFTQNSDNFSALKAVLEGSVSARTANMVIYATSNRRHLIRESFSDREGDDVHLRDTLEELSSLSDRFGLLVTFLRPDRELYLEIAERYCRQFGVEFGAEARREAEVFAIKRGGRSARAARQFAESLASQLEAGHTGHSG